MTDEIKSKLANGYVIYARALLDSRLWSCGPDATRLATWMILMARYDEKPKMLPDGSEVKRGELVTSLQRMSEGCEWYENRMARRYSRQKIIRLIEKLEEIGFCKRNSDTYGTHITICNYAAYQDTANYKSDTCGTPPEHPRNTPGTPAYIYNKGKKDKKDNNNNTKSVPKGGFFQMFPKKSNDDVIDEQCIEVLEYFNKKAGRNLKKPTQELRARLREKDLTMQQCKDIIDFKCREWIGGGLEKHLNLVTLFRPSNYDKYRDQAEWWMSKGRPDPNEIQQKANQGTLGFSKADVARILQEDIA